MKQETIIETISSRQQGVSFTFSILTSNVPNHPYQRALPAKKASDEQPKYIVYIEFDPFLLTHGKHCQARLPLFQGKRI